MTREQGYSARSRKTARGRRFLGLVALFLLGALCQLSTFGRAARLDEDLWEENGLKPDLISAEVDDDEDGQEAVDDALPLRAELMHAVDQLAAGRRQVERTMEAQRRAAEVELVLAREQLKNAQADNEYANEEAAGATLVEESASDVGHEAPAIVGTSAKKKKKKKKNKKTEAKKKTGTASSSVDGDLTQHREKTEQAAAEYSSEAAADVSRGKEVVMPSTPAIVVALDRAQQTTEEAADVLMQIQADSADVQRRSDEDPHLHAVASRRSGGLEELLHSVRQDEQKTAAERGDDHPEIEPKRTRDIRSRKMPDETGSGDPSMDDSLHPIADQVHGVTDSWKSSFIDDYAPCFSTEQKHLVTWWGILLCLLGPILFCYVVYMFYYNWASPSRFECHVISGKKVGILKEPHVGSEVMGYVPAGTSFWAMDRVKPGDMRTYYQLADRPGWVSECSRKDIQRPVVTTERKFSADIGVARRLSEVVA